MVVGVEPDGGPERDLSQPRAPEFQVDEAEALETLEVSGVDRERVLITRLGRVPLLPGLMDGPLQVEDQVGEREHLVINVCF